MNLGLYSKSITTVIFAGLGILTAALSDGIVSPVEYVNIAITLCVSVGVYLVPSLPMGPARVGKTIVVVAGAALSTLAIVVSDVTGFADVSASNWLAVVLAGAAAIGVYIVPNVVKAPAALPLDI